MLTSTKGNALSSKTQSEKWAGRRTNICRSRVRATSLDYFVIGMRAQTGTKGDSGCEQAQKTQAGANSKSGYK